MSTSKPRHSLLEGSIYTAWMQLKSEIKTAHEDLIAKAIGYEGTVHEFGFNGTIEGLEYVLERMGRIESELIRYKGLMELVGEEE